MQFLRDLLARLSLPVRLILGAAVIFVLLIIAAFITLRPLYQPVDSLRTPVRYTVTAGSSLVAVADQLEQQDIIPSSFLFSLLARWQGVSAAIRAGEYEFLPGYSPNDILAKMVSGESVQYRLTLVEGWTFRDALDAIWRAEKINATLRGQSLATIAQDMAIDRENPEGLLFPDTYFYTTGTTDLEILRRAHQRLQLVLTDSWDKRLGALPYNDSYEALIMASIIEKESSVGSERGHIAGVFIRRLELGMRLQSDPTVIYGMGSDYDGNIRRADLQTTTPYNTYRVNGLPPTPIALAGEESIRAAVNPLSSDYLYFVSRGDGSHYFSSTLEEHNAAVNRFQRQQESQ